VRRVVGIDPSLTSTGFAVVTHVDGLTTEYHTIPERVFLTASSFTPDPIEGKGAVAEAARVASIVDAVCVSAHGAERVMLEGLALQSRTGKYAERAHLFYALVTAFVARRTSVDSLAPSSLKKAVTSNGRASKDEVLDAVRAAWSDRGWEDGLKTGRFDRADAAALAWVAAAQAGFDVPELPTL
jgi:Holliday junction resolvasome RuvABC endonuclease subunit